MDNALETYLEQLRGLRFVTGVRMARGQGRGSAIELTTASGRHVLELELVRSHLRKQEAELWIGRAAARPDGASSLLCAPYVSRPMGERLREGGVHYVDQAGNVFLELRRGKRIEYVALVEGRALNRVVPAERAWRAASYQVLFAMLIQADLLNAPVRSLATAAGVSTTPVLQVRKRLVQQGLIAERKGQFLWAPRSLDQARQIWLAGYQSTLRPSLLIGRFRPRRPTEISELERELARALEGKAFRWGGAAAGFRLDPYYRGDRTVVHLDAPEISARDLAGLLGMVPDPQGPVVLLRSPGPLAFESPVKNTVHPLLAWVELLDEGHDRASEAAARIADKLLEASRVG